MRVEGRFIDASNATLFAQCSSEGVDVAVIYKPIAGERPLWDFPEGNLANRELAAYLLSEELGLHLIPFTIVREGPFGPGMVQEWIEVNDGIDIVELAQSANPRIRQMALFDAIVNNTDRKFGHILPNATGEIYGCDHGVTFHQDPKLRTVLWQFSQLDFTDNEIELLKRTREVVPMVLSTLITADEISALDSRVAELLVEGHFPEPSEDWPAVPWPPF